MEIQTFNNTSDVCSLCLEKSNSDLSPLTAESQLDTIYYKNILAIERTDSDLHLSACDKCLQQLKSFQIFIKTCQSSYEFIKNKPCHISQQIDVIIYEEEQEDLHLEIEVLDENDGEEAKETEPMKPKVPKARDKLCPFCGKLFLTPSKLNQHISIHTGYAPFKCSFCDKRMKRKGNLQVHERTHTGEMPYVCSICNKAFRHSDRLKEHMNEHTGRKEKCEICEKTFCSSSALRVHMRIHVCEAPFKCSFCDKDFRTSSACNSHMVTHSDERLFVCKHCGFAFKRNNELRKHEAIHTDEKPYRCELCDYACHKTSSLKRHVENCHS